MTDFSVDNLSVEVLYPTVYTEDNTGINATGAYQLLVQGNEQFVNEAKDLVNRSSARRQQTAPGQNPFCLLLNCIDSRESGTMVFSRGVGDILNVRTPGTNISGVGTYGANNGATVDNSVIASMEFGISAMNIPLVVVMGHTSCGAQEASYNYYDGIKPATTDPPYENTQIPYLITGLKTGSLQAIAENASANRAVQYQVTTTLNYLRDNSNIVNTFMNDANFLTLGALYDVETGAVEFAAYDVGAGTCAWTLRP